MKKNTDKMLYEDVLDNSIQLCDRMLEIVKKNPLQIALEVLKTKDLDLNDPKAVKEFTALSMNLATLVSLLFDTQCDLKSLKLVLQNFAEMGVFFAITQEENDEFTKKYGKPIIITPK